MSFLIDTCCVSELIKKEPNTSVLKWFADHDERSMYLSVITFGELRKGIEKLPDTKKKKELNSWVNEDLSNRFNNQILDISIEVANKWGVVLAHAEQKGLPVPAIDSLIAATAIAHGQIVVTRNTKDMVNSGVQLINPWMYEKT